MELAELAERAEQASGPDRDLDEAIDKAVNPQDWADGFFDPSRHALPAYSASIDAAMTLVPEGMLFAVVNCGIENPLRPDFTRASATVGYPDSGNVHVEAAVPALALCVAALRARASSQTKDD